MATVKRQMTPQIHFLVPFKANINFLRETVNSIVGQTVTGWKATVFNDSPNSAEVDALVSALNDQRFSVVNNSSPLGIGGNWNAALAAAEAEFATLVHADDVLAPTYGAAVLDLHQRYPDSYGVFTGVRIIDHDGNRKRFSAPDLAKKVLHPFLSEPCIVTGDDGLRSLLRGDFIFCPTVTYRINRLQQPVFDERLRMSLDLHSFAEAILRGERLVGTKAAHYYYRRHAASTTSSLNADSSRFTEELATYRHIADAAARVAFTRSARTGRRATIVKGHLLYSSMAAALRGKFSNSWRYARQLRS
jgi:glycosyltransferase involved in cell wall biosynthesis